MPAGGESSNTPFSAIVMAAGKGTRLKSDLPKVLHPLFGKPLLQRVLETLGTLSETHPVSRTVILLGHGKEAVQTTLESFALKFPVEAVIQEPQLGTGHAVLQAKEKAGALSGPVLVLSGDVPLLRAESLAALIECHAAQKNALTLVTAHLDEPFGYGRVITTAAGKVARIVEEKDATPEERQIRQINAGIYCLDWKTVSPLLHKLTPNNAQGEFYLTDLIALAIEAGLAVGASDIADATEILGVNSREDLARCHTVLSQRTRQRLMADGVSFIAPETSIIGPEVRIAADSVVYPHCYLDGDITIGAHCEIGPQTVIQGTVAIGEHSQVITSTLHTVTIGNHSRIGPYANLRDHTAITDHVRIGNFVEVKNAEIAPYTNAAHLAYLGDATLGTWVNIGAGTITANYDPIRDTKHRTTIADHAKVGCNAVLVAPVTVGEHACVAAGSVITRDVPAWDLAIARPRQTEIAQWVKNILEPVQSDA